MSDVHGAVASITLECPAVASAVPMIRRRLRAFAARNGANAHLLTAIAIAVTEAAANVVTHAYPNGDGPMRIDADVEDGELEIVVRDEGTGFTTDATPGAGLGLGLIRTSSHGFEVRDHPYGGVELWMRFTLDTTAGDGGS